MDSILSIYHPLSIVVSVLTLLLQVITAGVVLFRFRLTPAGIVAGGVYVVFAFLLLVSLVIGLATRGHPMLYTAISVIDVLFTLLLAVGIGLIPMSLRKLAEKT